MLWRRSLILEGSDTAEVGYSALMGVSLAVEGGVPLKGEYLSSGREPCSLGGNPAVWEPCSCGEDYLLWKPHFGQSLSLSDV